MDPIHRFFFESGHDNDLVFDISFVGGPLALRVSVAEPVNQVGTCVVLVAEIRKMGF